MSNYNNIIRHFTSTSDNVDEITKWVFGSLVVFSFLEAAFYPEEENLYGCFSFIIAWVLLYTFVLSNKGMKRNICLFPYMALLGLGLSFFWMPLIITFIEGKPLTFRFQNPYLTFNNQLLNLIMLIAAYRLCLKLYHRKNFLIRLWSKIGYFTPPTDAQVWAMGFVGLFSYLMMLSIQGTDEARVENLGVIGHVLQMAKMFTPIPFILLFRSEYGGDKGKDKPKNLLLLYFGLMVVLGIATGKRTMILGPVVTIIMCYLLPAITEKKRLFSTKNTILLIIGVYFVTGPVADLAAAMALGRDNSRQTSSEKTFENIWKIYQDKEMLHNLWQYTLSRSDNGGDNSSGWSEYYVDNILLDRFCNIRVCDATLYYANKLGYDNPRMQDYFYKQVLYQLPTPVLNAFGVNVNKFAEQYTPGDLISTEGLGLNHQYYGYRVAGDAGIGLYLWGYAYYFMAFFIYAALFYFMSSRVRVITSGLLIFPLLELNNLFRVLFTFNNATGIVGVVGMLLRQGWQLIVLYCLIYFIIRKIIR